MDHALKRTRESTSKVRTGCITCKARRVKCDEGKPVCRRCSVGGRHCAYSPVKVLPTRRNVVTIYLPPARGQPALFVHDAGLDFFHRRIAASLDSQLECGFWGQLVLQLAHVEPCIRHAVAAVSAVHQDVEMSIQHPDGYVMANHQAQEAWALAAKSLSARIGSQPDSHLVPLVCCLLFTCIEFLRGHAAMALLHIENGLHILAAYHHKRETTMRNNADILLSEQTAVEDTVLPIFSRLNILCSLAGRLTPPAYAATTEKGGTVLEDIADAGSRLVSILDTCIRFIGKASLKAAEFQIDVDDLVEQVRLETRLGAWRQQFENLVAQMKMTGELTSEPVKQKALHLLVVHYKVIHIWLRVCTTAGELATDAYQADFEELMSHAEQVIQLGAVHAVSQLPLVSFDIQILGPLYYTALKCRHAVTRKRALALLQFAPRREGLWNAYVAYATAKRVIEFEESQLDEQGWPDEAVRVHGLPLPDDQSRVQTVSDLPLNLCNDNYNIVLSPTSPVILEAKFRTKPWGLTGEWHTIREYIKP